FTPSGHHVGRHSAGAAEEHILIERRVEHPVRRAVADRLGGEIFDQLPMKPVGTSRDANSAALSAVKSSLARPFVLPVDTQKAHLVSSQRIRLALVLKYAKQLVKVR